MKFITNQNKNSLSVVSLLNLMRLAAIELEIDIRYLVGVADHPHIHKNMLP